jgi:hypothetical protein
MIAERTLRHHTELAVELRCIEGTHPAAVPASDTLRVIDYYGSSLTLALDG